MTIDWPSWWESACQSVIDLYFGGYADHRDGNLAESVLKTRELFFSQLLKSSEVDSGVLLELSTLVTAKWKSWFSRERGAYRIEREPGLLRHRALARSIVEEINTSDPKGRMVMVTMLQLNVAEPWLEHRNPGVILHSPDLFDDEAPFNQAVWQGYRSASDYVSERLNQAPDNSEAGTSVGAKLPNGSATVVGTFDKAELVMRVGGQFVDGVELGFEVVGDLSPPHFNQASNVHNHRLAGTVRNEEMSLGLFQGLLIEVTYPIVDEVVNTGKRIDDSTDVRPTINVFQRKPFGRKSLWLWVTPAPPGGVLDVSLQWPECHLEYKTWRIRTTSDT